MRYFIEMALQVGINRLFWQRSHVYHVFLSGAGPLSNRVVIWAGFFIAVIGSVIYLFRFKEGWIYLRRYFLASILCAYFIFFQYLFVSSTSNNPENGFPFIGLIFSLSMGLLLYQWERITIRFMAFFISSLVINIRYSDIS